MKKNLLIIGGAVIVVGLLVAAWVYVMFFGTPRELPNFADTFDFGFGQSEGEAPAQIEPVIATSTPTPTVNVAGKPLRQLTTRPVIGYRELTQTSTSANPVLLYAESGTGHIYSIDLKTGIEERRSGTTIVEAAEAVFSADGRYVVYRSGYNRVARTVVGTLSSTSDSLTVAELGDQAENVTIEGNEILFYSVRGTTATGKSRNLRTGASKTLFTVPISDPVVLWGGGETADHFIYPKPSYLLPGYVYKVGAGGSLTRLPISGFGLSAFRSGPFVAIGTVEPGSGRYETTIFDTSDNTSIGGLGTFIPEKCTSSPQSYGKFWCGEGQSSVPFGYPDTWHRGEYVASDNISELNLGATSTQITPVVNTNLDSGRTIDGVDFGTGPSGSSLFFINRLDNTLWLYELSK